MLTIFLYYILPGILTFFSARLYNSVETQRSGIITPGFAIVFCIFPFINIMSLIVCSSLYIYKHPKNEYTASRFYNWFTCGKK